MTIKNNKRTTAVAIIFLLVSLVPLLYIGRYNVMSADDYSMCKKMHQVIIKGGGIDDMLECAISYVIRSYKTWIGCYTVSFMDVWNPGVIDEKFTYITPIIMIGSILVFLYVTINCLISFFYDKGKEKKYKNESLFIWALFSFITIETMPSPSEAFYWYAGAIAYTTLHYLLFVFLTLEIWSGKLIHTKQKRIYVIACSMLALILGGSQYTTGLLAVIGTTFFIIILNKKIKWHQVFPILFLYIGFGISLCSPGNRARQSNAVGMTPIKAIYSSFGEAFHFGKDWITPLFILTILILLPVMNKLIKQNKNEYKYAYPAGVCFFSLCIFASGFTPSLYGVGNVSSGRIHNQLHILFYVLSLVDIFYILGWLNNRLDNSKKEVYKDIRNVINIFTKYESWLQGFFFVCLVLVFVGTSDKNTFSSISALRSLISGEAHSYYAEAQIRLNDYHNDDMPIVEVNPFSAKPYVLYFTDVAEEGEQNYWINESIAEYYGKEKVLLRKQ